MDKFFESVVSWAGVEVWVGQAFLVILAALLLEFAYRRFIRRVRLLAKKSEHLWDDAIVYAGMKPVSLLIWSEGLILAARIVSPHTDVVALDPALLNTIQQLVLVIAATWFAFRLVTGAEQAFVAERRKRDEHVDITTVAAIGRIFRIAVILTGFTGGTQYPDFRIPRRGWRWRHCHWPGSPRSAGKFLWRIHGVHGSAILSWRLGAITGPRHRGRGGKDRLAHDHHSKIRQTPDVCPQRDFHVHNRREPIEDDEPQDIRAHRGSL